MRVFQKTDLIKIPAILFFLLGMICFLLPYPCGAQDVESEKVQKLEDIVVSSTKMETDVSRTPTNVTVISQEDIAKYKARDVLDLLQQVPGLDFIRDAYGLPTDTQMSTRGSEPSAFLLKFMVNGIEFNNGSGYIMPCRIPIHDIERIEVIKAPSAIYGDQAAGGIVNVITRQSKEKIEAKLGVAAGGYGTEEYYSVINGRNGKWEYFADIGAYRTDGYQYGAWYEKYNPYGRFRYNIDDTSSLAFHGAVYHGSGIYPQSITLDQFEEDPRTNENRSSELNSEHSLVALVYEKTIGETDIRAELYTNWDESYWYLGSKKTTNEERLIKPDLRLVHRHDIGQMKNAITVGGDFRYYENESRKHTFTDLQDDELTDKKESEDTTWGAFIQDELQVSNSFTVTVGLRWDYYENDQTVELGYTTDDTLTSSDSALSPKVGMTYTFTEAVNLFAGLNSGFKNPSKVSTQSESLKPERVWSYEAGIRGYPTNWFNYNIAGFWTVFSDKILRVRDLPVPEYENAGKAESKGVELGLNVDFDSGIYGSLNYTYQDSIFVDYTVSGISYDDNQVPRVPENLFGFKLGYRHTTFGNVNIYATYTDKRFLDNDNLVEVDSYWLWNAKYSKRINFSGLEFDFFLAGENLTDEEYVGLGWAGADAGGNVLWSSIYPGRGRLITGGLNFFF